MCMYIYTHDIYTYIFISKCTDRNIEYKDEVLNKTRNLKEIGILDLVQISATLEKPCKGALELFIIIFIIIN